MKLRRIVALGGEPAVGKSTIMKKFMEGYSWEEVKPTDLVYGHYCKDLDLYVIGKYDEDSKFPGTDTLSMAVQPPLTKWIKETKSNVIFEGDRVFNQSFLEMIVDDIHDAILKIIYIDADEEVKERRHVDRNDSQSDKFKKGRKTKYDRLRNNFTLMDCAEDFMNNTPEDMEIIVARMKELAF